MRFAVVEGIRVEATPSAVGFCPGCGATLVPRCGTKKVWHWAHKGRRHCDHWWEAETEWHRSWKDRFPKEWQEIPARDEHGELHIADLKTPHDLVVEFQHSKIDPKEARKRTAFHAPIIWVIDGLRRKTDKIQFEKVPRKTLGHRTMERTISRISPFDARLIEEWYDLRAIVASDFGDDDVWLMSGRDWACGIGFWYEKERLVANITDGTQIPHVFSDQTNTGQENLSNTLTPSQTHFRKHKL